MTCQNRYECKLKLWAEDLHKDTFVSCSQCVGHLKLNERNPLTVKQSGLRLRTQTLLTLTTHCFNNASSLMQSRTSVLDDIQVIRDARQGQPSRVYIIPCTLSYLSLYCIVYWLLLVDSAELLKTIFFWVDTLVVGYNMLFRTPWFPQYRWSNPTWCG